MIDDLRAATGQGIRRVCDVLHVPRSSYYHATSPTAAELSDRDIGRRIEGIFNRHRRRYGHRRIWRELADAGITCATARVRRIMAERGLKAIQPKTYMPRTSDGRADKPSPNLLVGTARPPRSRVGRRHHLRVHCRGIALSRRGHRPLHAPHRRLVAGPPHACRAGGRRLEEIAPNASPRSRTDLSQRPWQPTLKG